MIKSENIMGILQPPVPETDEAPENDVTNNTITLPLWGRLHFVRDSQGQLFVSGVVAYWMFGTFSTIFVLLHPAYEDGHVSLPVVYGFYAVSGLCLLSLMRASLTNPGRIPSYDFSKHAETGWTLCQRCNRMRPPRSHHCRRCGQCVMRMDHHCPWINNCVGEDNHFAFVQLLVYAFLLGFYSFILLMCHFWVFPKCNSCNRDAIYIKHGIWFMYVDFLLALNIMFMMGVMVTQQHFHLIINRTTIETMLKPPKAKEITVRQTYTAYRELCGRGLPLFWWLPIGRRRPLLPTSHSQNV
ncbi:probable palmitoyltransferase ZDHHC21 [Aplysia californica]|uniref:Palmitoyltransferase n=1 Tax=Aplysia californica TaxID=6500 RepID=A0ABM0JKV4_APLCA|nr:probable palmitoyltransferase ZDHHC21 [Aplysia californica]XP_005096082.1 probable palmitoyltransferase ZDHHC21 [Aplysia californica]